MSTCRRGACLLRRRRECRRVLRSERGEPHGRERLLEL